MKVTVVAAAVLQGTRIKIALARPQTSVYSLQEFFSLSSCDCAKTAFFRATTLSFHF